MVNPSRQDEWQTVRVNLIEPANQRFSDSSVLGATSGLTGVGLTGTMIVGLTTTVSKDVRLINCYVSKLTSQYSQESKTYINKRPGFVLSTTPSGTEVGNAIRIWLGQGTGGKVISAFGATNSTIYDGITSLGAITGLARDITETFVGTTANLVIPSSDNTAWYYPDGGALTKIADVDFPGNAGLTTTGTFVHLDGYAFIMTTDGRIWNSDLASVTAWTSTSFISAQLSPDKGVGLARYKNKIVAFGKESIEFFEDVGNFTGSPLQRIPEAFIKIGAPTQNLITNVEDTIVFVGSSSNGSYSVYMIQNYQPQKISYPEIDGLLSQIGISNFTASVIKLWGKSMFVLHSSTRTFIYSLEDAFWCEWNSATPLWYKMAGDTQENIYSISNSSAAGVIGRVFIVSQQTLAYQDNGASYTMVIQTKKFDFGSNKRKRMSRLRVIGDQSSSANTLSITYSDDDYQTYGTSRDVDLTSADPYLNNLGSFRRRSFLLVNNSSTSVRIEGLETDLIFGIS